MNLIEWMQGYQLDGRNPDSLAEQWKSCDFVIMSTGL